MNKIFGANVVNAKFSMKIQIFIFKMEDKVTMSNHIINLKSLIRQLALVKVLINDDDVKSIMLNSFLSKYNNDIIIFSQNKFLES